MIQIYAQTQTDLILIVGAKILIDHIHLVICLLDLDQELVLVLSKCVHKRFQFIIAGRRIAELELKVLLTKVCEELSALVE